MYGRIQVIKVQAQGTQCIEVLTVDKCGQDQREEERQCHLSEAFVGNFSLTRNDSV